MSRRRIVFVLIIFLGAVAAVFLLLRPSKQRAGLAEAQQRPVPVETSAAHQGDIGVSIEALGTVTSVYTVNVVSRVQGQIMNVIYREGQLVKKGDPLIEIDPRPYEAALLQAEGQLARDEAALRAARIDLVRYRKAYSTRAIPKQQLDDQEQLVFQDEGAVKADQGVLQNAKVNLAYCHITSPIDGRVGLRLLDPGNIVQANSATALVVITQFQPITVIFSVAEDFLPQIQEQLRLGNRMEVDAFDRTNEKKLATGSFLTLDSQIDPTTGTIKLKAVFENRDDVLFPNQFVNARLLVNVRHGVTLIPSAAIQYGAQGSFVYVIKPNNTVEVRSIKVGPTESGASAVEGVSPGETVVITGFEKLREGIKVGVQRRSDHAEMGGTAGSSAQPNHDGSKP